MLLILIVVLIVLMLIDYFADENRKKNSHNKYNKNFSEEKYGFTVVSHNSMFEFYEVNDNETKVMYVISDDYHNEGSITLLVDENGKPKLYKEN